MWILLAVLSALGDSLRDVWTKKISHQVPQQLITWAFSVYSLPILLIYSWNDIHPHLDQNSALAILLCVLLHTFGGIYLVKALAASDISLTIPMVAFTPVWLLLIGPFVQEELPSKLGIAGAVMVVLGSYLIKAPKGFKNILTPFTALFRQRGPRIMLFLSMLWAVTASIDKVYSPEVGLKGYALCQMTGIIFGQAIVFKIQKVPLSKVATHAKYLIPVGFFNALSYIPYLIALSIAPAYFVVSGKRMSILFTVILGHFVFREREVEKRFFAAFIMLAGVIMISLAR